MLALLAADPTAPTAGDGGATELESTAIQIAQALLASDVEKLTALSPPGFAFDGREAWSQADIRAEWTQALGRRSLTGLKIHGAEVLDYDEMVKRHGAPPERWSRINLSATRIAIVDLDEGALLVIFRKRGDAWVPLGVSN